MEQVSQNDEFFERRGRVIIDIGSEVEGSEAEKADAYDLSDEDHPMVGLHEGGPVDVTKSLQIQHNDEEEEQGDEARDVSLDAEKEPLTDV